MQASLLFLDTWSNFAARMHRSIDQRSRSTHEPMGNGFLLSLNASLWPMYFGSSHLFTVRAREPRRV